MELLGGIQRVEHAIQTPAGDPAWRPAVTQAVAQLKAAFAAHVRETEGPSGLYAGVLGDAPRLAQGLYGLVGDHETVWEALDKLEGHLELEGHPVVCQDAVRLIHEVWQHRQRGADLLYEAYDTDLGGET
ncbi:hypothetical protein ACFO1B_07260 [Dactylosporangium siamense]|uniref:Hemerythrin-like domain-containing protein n=1 Tax=Dactylosporangium siamense TaxID=685454 RepID=A0A919UAE4_9ACTN|nr:hypothetical protein [Dactylosporangium siamense]GIG43558.1 hypothetical protein Dsi01nite_015990 [Dactylosporangium siamense]